MSKLAPWKLSPSKFHFGFDNCQRCYYLDIKEGITQPGSFPGVFSKLDVIHKNFFIGQHTSDVLTDIPAGTFIKGPGDKFLESELIEFDDPNKNCFISGKGDAFLELDDGTYAIIDFKTSMKVKKEEWISNYFMQESAYAVMWEERVKEPITQLVTLIANDTNEPQVFIQHRDQWIHKFIDVRQQYEER